MRVEIGAKRVRPYLAGGLVVDGAATAAGAGLRYPDSPLEALRARPVRLDRDAMDEWFEEDEPVSVHPARPVPRGRRAASR